MVTSPEILNFALSLHFEILMECRDLCGSWFAWDAKPAQTAETRKRVSSHARRTLQRAGACIHLEQSRHTPLISGRFKLWHAVGTLSPLLQGWRKHARGVINGSSKEKCPHIRRQKFHSLTIISGAQVIYAWRIMQENRRTPTIVGKNTLCPTIASFL